MAPFVIFGLPRSRTAWLSKFLTYGDWICGHEELRHCRSLDDVKAWFSQPCIGTAETAGAPWWRMIPRFAPDARVLVVRRPVEEVVDSLMALDGVAFDRAKLTAETNRLDHKLDQIEARVPNVMSVNFADLKTEATCRAVFEHCLPHKFDRSHWSRWDRINVQCDMRAMTRHYAAYKLALDKLAAIAKHQTISSMAAHKPVSMDGMTFQTEDFDTWVKDAKALFDDHLVQVGEAPGDWQEKNLPLMRRIYEIGAMQIMTARSNGRMFGYLMTLISPSLTSESVTEALHTTFFASSDAPGLGLKLQRAALSPLKDHGVDDLYMRAGVRGSGDRLGSIYRRIGAQDFGQMFHLNLTEQ